jgi:hypothetical protein
MTGVSMTVRILVLVIGLAVSSLVALAPLGEIAGRISDEQHSALSGTRIRITNGNQSREVVTDRDGRFLVGGLSLATYSVVAELAGFSSTSGRITLSPSTPRALLAWSLKVGCLEEIQRVILGPRGAARLVDAIVHMRVGRNAGPVRISDRPDCEGRVFDEYVVEVLGAVPGRGNGGTGHRPVFMEPRGAHLTPGYEYLALLWPDGYTSDDLVLPVVSGRVMAPGAPELNGLGAKDALDILAKWSEKR